VRGRPTLSIDYQHSKKYSAFLDILFENWSITAGRLDPALGGGSVRDFNTPRRTLYLTTIRSDRTGFQSLFDGADPTVILEKRNEATIAPQSLFLLNHPFTLAQAEALAAASAQANAETRDRVRWLWRRLFQRDPAPEDDALAARVLGTAADATRWTAFCQTLLCSNEFIYVD
jgi:hypothetical protein